MLIAEKNGFIGNEFIKDLEYSMNLKDDKVFNDLYYRVFPELKLITFVTDIVEQKKGIDKKLLFKNGNTITVDEKKRKKDYGDILLELISNHRTRKLGWLFTAECDYICYFIEPTRIAYLLPMLLLRMAWKSNRTDWVKQYEIKEAQNPGYKSKSICIPTKVLMESLAKEMQQNYKDYKEVATNEL